MDLIDDYDLELNGNEIYLESCRLNIRVVEKTINDDTVNFDKLVGEVRTQIKSEIEMTNFSNHHEEIRTTLRKILDYGN